MEKIKEDLFLDYYSYKSLQDLIEGKFESVNLALFRQLKKIHGLRSSSTQRDTTNDNKQINTAVILINVLLKILKKKKCENFEESLKFCCLLHYEAAILEVKTLEVEKIPRLKYFLDIQCSKAEELNTLVDIINIIFKGLKAPYLLKLENDDAEILRIAEISENLI